MTHTACTHSDERCRAGWRRPHAGQLTGAGRQGGLTLVELLVVLGLLATMVFAIPSFLTFLEQQNLTSHANEFMLSVSYARSESVRRGGTVSVQGLVGPGSGSDNEFGEGWCVVVGSNGSCDATAETVLRNYPATGFTFDATGDLDDVNTLSFNARGLLVNQIGGATNLDLCPDTSAFGRRLTISPIGRVRVEEMTAGAMGC